MRIFLPFVCLLLALAAGAGAQTAPVPTKVGVIDIQDAIMSTREGQKAAAELQSRYDPKRKDLEKKQADIAALSDQYTKGSNTMSEEAKAKLTLDIDQKTKVLNRDREDAAADFQQDSDKILNELGQRFMAVLDKYARDNGYAVLLDVGAQQTAVVWATNGANIKDDIVALYDKNTADLAPAASKPATPAKPPAAAPAKK
jgi:outer membrane protein